MPRAVHLLAVAAIAAACADSTAPLPDSGAPMLLEIVSGDLQTGVVGQELAEPLVVRVLDDDGQPVAGQVVNFRVTAGQGSVFAGVAVTDTDGYARERWTLGTVAGETQTVEARAVDTRTGQALVFGSFSAVGLPDTPVSLAIVPATPADSAVLAGESVDPGTMINLTAVAQDQYGNPVTALEAVWLSSHPGVATVSPDGTVHALAPGSVTITVVAGGLFAGVDISVRSTAVAPGIFAVSGGGADPNLVVQVRDQFGAPVPGQLVIWSITSGAATLSNPVSHTDQAGFARTTVSGVSGTVTVIATAPGLQGSPVVFTLHAATMSNYALDFSDSWVTVPDHPDLDLANTWTIEAWIKPRNAGQSAFQHVISKWNGGGDASYTLEVHAGHLRVAMHDGVNNTVVESVRYLANDAWQHVAVTFAYGIVKLYVGGVLDREIYGAVTPMNSTRPVSFGREGEPYGGWRYEGLIDEVRIWTVARSAYDIARAMNASLTGHEYGLVGLWHLNEGAGDVAFDATGRGHHGRLGNIQGPDGNDPRWVTDAAPIQ